MNQENPRNLLSAELHRRKREKALIVFLVLVLAVLFYIENHFPALPSDLPLSSPNIRYISLAAQLRSES